MIAFGLIASAVCGLLGPIFVPFFIVPKLDWLFWGWLRSFIQYSFIPVVAVAFLMIFERFVFRYVTTLPPTITHAEFGVYGLQAVAVVVTFCMGILLVPSLTQSIFSGQAGSSASQSHQVRRPIPSPLRRFIMAGAIPPDASMKTYRVGRLPPLARLHCRGERWAS